ncbi:MAG: germination protease [Sedimentibacter sp.]|jgi:putative sporulation protein YyaC|nr:germination protease [Sedimentibacter sp.]
MEYKYNSTYKVLKTISFTKEISTTRIFKNDKNYKETINNTLYSLISSLGKEYNKICIVCIGSDRATGDCLGPIVGKFLSEKFEDDDFIKVYGTLLNPIHAKNIEELMDSLDYSNSLVIAIDASVGDDQNPLHEVGSIIIRDAALMPGKGCGKDLGHIGDISITGITTHNAFYLRDVRLLYVFDMAEKIYKGLKPVLNTLKKEFVLRG